MATLPAIPNLLPKLAQGEYPLPAFHFRVTWDDETGQVEGSFTEVSGLNQEIQFLEYRDGTRKTFATAKIPGMRKDNNITLKRGIFAGKNDLYAWWDKIKNLGETDARGITISLLNENHEPVVTWNLVAAWPVKLEGPALKSDGNEVAVETMELVHEGMTMKHETKAK